MRIETTILGLIGVALAAFFLGWVTAGSGPDWPSRPSLQTVRPAATPLSGAPAQPKAPAEATAPTGIPRAPAPPLAPVPAPVPAAPGGVGVGGVGASASAGPLAAKVTMTIASEFQCPYSRRAAPHLGRLAREYRDELRIVWKHYPLGFHQRAVPAAKAAIAAQRQGRFWEMHDLLFKNAGPPSDEAILGRAREMGLDAVQLAKMGSQQLRGAAARLRVDVTSPEGLSDENLVRHARELGLDVARFEKDMADPSVEEQIGREHRQAWVAGAAGTPAFFVNGRFYSGSLQYSRLKQIIDEAIEEADALLASGTPIERVHETLGRLHAGETWAPSYLSYVVRAETPPPDARPAVREGRNARTARPLGVEATVWKVPVDPQDPVRGPADALVTVVVFSDFGCGFCDRVRSTLDRMVEGFPREIRIVWKNLERRRDRSAPGPAEAALAAHAQGRFWEMHDLLFENRGADRAALDDFAQRLTLDLAAFRTTLDTRVHNAQIERDRALADQVGVAATPTLFVNGRMVRGYRSYEDLEPLLLEELEKARKMVAAGVSRDRLYHQLMLRGKTKR